MVDPETSDEGPSSVDSDAEATAPAPTDKTERGAARPKPTAVAIPRRVIVVGAGVAGLLTAIKLAEASVPVDLVSLQPAKRSPSVAASSGVAAALDARGDGDSPRLHLEDAVVAGGFLANQPLLLGMTEAAPDLVKLLARLGVPFDRTPEGRVAFRQSGGASHARTAFAGATTGQQILYALDDQVRRLETEDVRDGRGIAVRGEKLVRRHEHFDLLDIVRDDKGIAVGIVAQDLRSMRVRAFPGDAVVLATGGPGAVFGRCTSGVLSTGGAASVAYRAGAAYANGELIQVHPTAIAFGSSAHVVPEALRAVGGRLWVPKDTTDKRAPASIPERERDYFFERLHPGEESATSRHLVARAMFSTVFDEEKGIADPESGTMMRAVYLDLAHVMLEGARDRALIATVGPGLEAYAKRTGIDPTLEPMRVFPAVHASMGGLWVDFERDARGAPVAASPRNHATNIPGLYAVGEVEYQYHGADRVSDNALVACLYAAGLASAAVLAHRAAFIARGTEIPRSTFDKAERAAETHYRRILEQNADKSSRENAYALHRELGEAMFRDCTVVRDNEALGLLVAKLDELDERVKRVKTTDTGARNNQGAVFVRHLEGMMVLARVIALGARRRDESRGSHYKPAFPERDDARFLKTTLALHGGPGEVRFVTDLEYACVGKGVHATDSVDASLVEPG